MNIWEIFTGRKYRTGKRKEGDERDLVDRRSITATDPEWEYVTEMAEKNAISPSAYVRLLIMIDQVEGGLTPEKVHDKKKLKELQSGVA